MNTRYIEVDSTYRDRNLYPYPSEFEIPIAQSGAKDKNTALDPVSLAAPVNTWKSNYFNINDFYITNPTLTLEISTNHTIDSNTLILNSISNNKPQNITNYYVNAIIESENGTKSRIYYYKYLGYNSSTGKYCCIIKVIDPFPQTDLHTGTTFTIRDPTDLSNTSFPLFFVPYGRLGENAYPKNILYNETRYQYRLITGYDSDTHLLYVDAETNPVTDWSAGDLYSIRKEPPIISGTIYSIEDNSTFNILLQTLNPSLINNLFFRIPKINQIRKILSCTFILAPNQYKIVVDKPFDINLSTIGLPEYEILQFSYDNAVPFVYSGSLVSQQNEVCYEISLLNLKLPNTTLNVGQGSRIAFYPYVYVELSNVSSAGKGLTNIIYSNNPNSIKMLFRASVSDTTDPLNSTYVNLNGDGAVQTVKFKPNDNLKFSVRMPNGDLYETLKDFNYSPYLPDLDVQISALFSIKRL
jgi:hypothetical protein